MIFTPEIINLVKASEFVRRVKEEGRVVLDNTEFSNWNSCFVKGLWNGACRKVSATGQTPLLFGQAVHTGLEALMRGASLSDALEAARADAIESRLDSYIDPKRNTQNLELLLTSYVQHTNIINGEKIIPFEVEGTPLVEMPFSVPLGEVIHDDKKIQVIWSGKIDVIGTTRELSGLWVFDHKTTSVMGEKFADGYLRSSQMLGYARATQMIVANKDLKIEGVVINALASRSKGYEFKQFQIPFSKWKLEEWHTETLHAVRELLSSLDNFISFGEAAPNREQCVSKYGRCSYFDLCEAPPNIRFRTLNDESFFIDNKWNGAHL